MTHYPTAHLVYINMSTINQQLNENIKSGPPHIVHMIQPMQAKYKKYWQQMEDFAAITLVFDPRYKLALLEFLLSKENPSNKAAIGSRLKVVKDNISAWVEEIHSQQNKNKKTPDLVSANQAPSHPKTTPLGSDQEFRFKEYLAGRHTSKSTWGSAEIDLYLEESTVPIDTPSFDILKWWSIKSLRFPTLSILAKRILMVPMTSIASELAFSTGGRVLRSSRSHLKPERLEALIYGQD